MKTYTFNLLIFISQSWSGVCLKSHKEY